jgi:hypothetical protein
MMGDYPYLGPAKDRNKDISQDCIGLPIKKDYVANEEGA